MRNALILLGVAVGGAQFGLWVWSHYAARQLYAASSLAQAVIVPVALSPVKRFKGAIARSSKAARTSPFIDFVATVDLPDGEQSRALGAVAPDDTLAHAVMTTAAIAMVTGRVALMRLTALVALVFMMFPPLLMPPL